MISDKPHLPILLIHGYSCNSGYWSRFSDVLHAKGLAHYAINLEPILADIDSYAPQLAEKIEAICAASGQSQVILIGHSMGGLVSRCYLRAYGNARVAHVITLGTPHNGTALANFAPGMNSMQMSYTKQDGSSAWLKQLQASEAPHTRALFTSIFSHQDNIISPQSSSVLEGARNIPLHGMGHVALALNQQVQQTLLAEITRINLDFHAKP